MKENGINKLTVLLDEYKEENNILNTDMNGQLEIGNYIYVNYPCAEKLCGKRYGFIKRLIDNDKIDFDNRELKDKFMEEFERYPTFHNNTYNQDFNINGLLMLLAISDTPIEDLIKYLK